MVTEGHMATIPAVSLKHHFADLIDPRGQRSRRHELLDVVGITLCAVIAGAESWPAVEAYGRVKRDWLARHSACPTASPRMTPSAASSAGSTPRRSSGASPRGSRP